MVHIPLILKLKRREHKDLAVAHDIIIKEMLEVFEKAVLHGGTAIWRCYNGNRFSEDIDVYLQENNEKIEQFFKNLENRGFSIQKRRIRKNTIFSKLKKDNRTVRFEALLKFPQKNVLKEYETADGNLITIKTLSPEELIMEKVQAYLNRRKIRDLYDIFFLLRYTKNKKMISSALKKLIQGYKEPLDKEQLKELIITGLTPDSRKMMNYIRGF